MSNRFHAEVWACRVDTCAGANGPMECHPAYLLSLPPSMPALHASQRPCQAYFCLCSSIQTYPSSGMFSLSFLLPESCLPSKAPLGLTVPIYHPSDTSPTEASPGLLQRVSGRPFTSQDTAPCFGPSFYSWVLCPQLTCPLALCLVRSRCFMVIKHPCGVPPLSNRVRKPCTEFYPARSLGADGRSSVQLLHLTGGQDWGSENEGCCPGSLC